MRSAEDRPCVATGLACQSSKHSRSEYLLSQRHRRRQTYHPLCRPFVLSGFRNPGHASSERKPVALTLALEFPGCLNIAHIRSDPGSPASVWGFGWGPSGSWCLWGKGRRFSSDACRDSSKQPTSDRDENCGAVFGLMCDGTLCVTCIPGYYQTHALKALKPQPMPNQSCGKR